VRNQLQPRNQLLDRISSIGFAAEGRPTHLVLYSRIIINRSHLLIGRNASVDELSTGSLGISAMMSVEVKFELIN
jgi:hypothetical protein